MTDRLDELRNAVIGQVALAFANHWPTEEAERSLELANIALDLRRQRDDHEKVVTAAEPWRDYPKKHLRGMDVGPCPSCVLRDALSALDTKPPSDL